MNLEDVHVVLVRPRWARNLGAAARAMKNFGLRRLSLVDSRIGSWSDAYRMAVHADDILRAAVTATDLAATLAGAQWIVGTTNRPLPGQRLLTPRELANEAAHRGAPTLLFGGEENGLTHHELLHCHDVSTIPVAPEQSSLNLAQAVVVYAAELFAASGHTAPALPVIITSPLLADASMLQRVETALRHLLETSAWTDACRPKNAIAELMQPLYRAQLTDDEVRAWLVALGKAVQR